MSIKIVGIDAAIEGMVLARDLCDSGGNVLLGQGATLSEASLRSLRRRGVEELSILGAQDSQSYPDEAVAAAERQRRYERLDHVFRHTAEHQATAALLLQLRRYRCGEPV